MSKFAHDCYFQDWNLKNVENDTTVDYIPTYTNETVEPLYLPGKYPVFAMNWHQQMGLGKMTSTIGLGVRGACESIIKLVNDPEAQFEVYPEDPQGCDIINKCDLKGFLDRENTKIKVRATYEVDVIRGTTYISILSTPYEVNPKTIIDTIAELCNKGKLPGIADIEGDSEDYGMSFVIEIAVKKGYDPKSIMNQLYKSTQLQKTFSTRYTFVDEFENHDYTPRITMLEWIRYRKDVIKREKKIALAKNCKRIHVLDAMIDLTEKDKINTAIDIIRHNKKVVAFAKLINQLNVTDYQAMKITGMELSHLSEEYYESYIAERKELQKDNKRLKSIIKGENTINETIINDMLECIERYPAPRKSNIYQLVDSVGTVPDTDHFLVFTNKYIKKIDYSPAGYKIGRIDEGDKVKKILTVNNRDAIAIFDKNGKVSIVQVCDIDITDSRSIGISLSRFKVNEIFADALLLDDNAEGLLTTVTANGYITTASYSDLLDITKTKVCMKISTGDSLISAVHMSVKDEILIYTGNGKATLFKTDSFEITSLGTKGVCGIKVGDGDAVTGAISIKPDDTMLLVSTDRAYMKTFSIKNMPISQRNTAGIEINTGNGTVTSLCSYDSDTDVLYGYTNIQAFELDPTKITSCNRLGKNTRVLELPSNVYLFNISK